VIGATGQLGSDLVRTFDRPGKLTPLGSRDLDVLDAARVRSTLVDLRPTVVINATAYNFVDRAEEERSCAFALNAEAVGSLAATCHALGGGFAPLLPALRFDGHQR